MLWDLEDGRVTATKESFTQVKEGIDAGEPIPRSICISLLTLETAWVISLSPQGDHYASTGSSGTVRINSANPDNFGETLETLSPRTDGRNKFGMHVVYVRWSLLTSRPVWLLY